MMETRLPDIDLIYPVGSVIVTTSDSDPRLSLGTWERIGNGRYVRAAGEGEQAMLEGGSSEIALAAENMPAHSHGATASTSVESGGAHTHSGTANSGGAHTHTQHTETVYNTEDYDGWISKDGGGFYAASGKKKATASAGAHTHSLTVKSGGAHSHAATTTVSVEEAGSASPTPIPVQPEYVTLIFYRRTA